MMSEDSKKAEEKVAKAAGWIALFPGHLLQESQCGLPSHKDGMLRFLSTNLATGSITCFK